MSFYLERLQVELKTQVEQLPFAVLGVRKSVVSRVTKSSARAMWSASGCLARLYGVVSLLPGTGRAILRELAAWRLQTARTNDGRFTLW